MGHDIIPYLYPGLGKPQKPGEGALARQCIKNTDHEILYYLFYEL